jgi:hypothetical protein
MDEATAQAAITAIAAIFAALMTFATAWLANKKGQAYDQGDLLIKQAQDEMKIADGLVQVFPDLAPSVAKLKDALNIFQLGWEDKTFSTTQMITLQQDIKDLITDIAAVVKAKTGKA